MESEYGNGTTFTVRIPERAIVSTQTMREKEQEQKGQDRKSQERKKPEGLNRTGEDRAGEGI